MLLPSPVGARSSFGAATTRISSSGKPDLEQRAECLDHVGGDVGVHEHLAGVRTPVEAEERHGEVAQLAGLHGAAGSPVLRMRTSGGTGAMGDS